MDPADKAWIDGATYEQLLERWRFAPIGARMFQGETGAYYTEVMRTKRAAVGDAAHTAASKAIGWDR